MTEPLNQQVVKDVEDALLETDPYNLDNDPFGQAVLEDKELLKELNESNNRKV